MLVNPVIEFDLREFDADVFAGLSQGLRDVIANSPEYAQAMGTGTRHDDETVAGHLDDSPPYSEDDIVG